MVLEKKTFLIGTYKTDCGNNVIIQPMQRHMYEKELFRPILWATIEDYVGLWEILWEVNSILPNEGTESKRSVISFILKLFFEQELINFYSGVWGESDSFIELCHEALGMLDQEKYWQCPEINDSYIAISSTEKGEQVYNEFSAEQLAKYFSSNM